jgi:hypothetical protein
MKLHPQWRFGGAVIGGIHVNPNMAFDARNGLGDAPDWERND